jgi:hypothetical protein
MIVLISKYFIDHSEISRRDITPEAFTASFRPLLSGIVENQDFVPRRANRKSIIVIIVGGSIFF